MSDDLYHEELDKERREKNKQAFKIMFWGAGILILALILSGIFPRYTSNAGQDSRPTRTPKPKVVDSKTLNLCGIDTGVTNDLLRELERQDNDYWNGLSNRQTKDSAAIIMVHQSGQMTESQVCRTDPQEFVDCFDVFASSGSDNDKTLKEYGELCGNFVRAALYD